MTAKISPPIVLRLIPTTQKVFIATIAVMGLFNLLDFALHGYDPESFEQWLVFSAPVTGFMSHAVWAVGQISSDMHRFGIDQRIGILVNVISIDWLIYLLGIAGMVAATCFDFIRDGGRITMDIRNIAKDVSWDWDDILKIDFIFSLLFFFIIYTGMGYYYPIPLYRNDIAFMFSIIYFYYALSFPITLFAFFLMRFFPEDANTTPTHGNEGRRP